MLLDLLFGAAQFLLQEHTASHGQAGSDMMVAKTLKDTIKSVLLPCTRTPRKHRCLRTMHAAGSNPKEKSMWILPSFSAIPGDEP